VKILKKSSSPVIVTTHSGDLVSKICKEVGGDVKIYYLKSDNGNTKFYEIKESSYTFYDIIEEGDVLLKEMEKEGEARCINCSS